MRSLHSRRTRRASRPGFSIIELMMVFAIFALLVAIGVPRFNYMRATTHMRSAKTEIAAVLATARATAIRRGQPAEVRRVDNTLVVLSGADTIVRPVRLDTLYLVTVDGSAPSTVRYDSRGMATAGGASKFKFSRDSYADSVCVTVLGAVQRNGCLQ